MTNRGQKGSDPAFYLSLSSHHSLPRRPSPSQWTPNSPWCFPSSCLCSCTASSAWKSFCHSPYAQPLCPGNCSPSLKTQLRCRLLQKASLRSPCLGGRPPLPKLPQEDVWSGFKGGMGQGLQEGKSGNPASAPFPSEPYWGCRLAS